MVHRKHVAFRQGGQDQRVYFPYCENTMPMRLQIHFSILLLCLSLPSAGTSPVDSIVASLSLERKLAQMIVVYHSPYEFLDEHGFGGVLVMQNMINSRETLRYDLDSIQKNLPIPLLVCIDQEGGKINRLGKLPKWKGMPSPATLGTWSTDSVRSHASLVGQELRRWGINTNFAPVVDPSVNAQGRRTLMGTSERSFGHDAKQIVAYAKAFSEGFGDEGVLCITKHFPGYDVAENSDKKVAVSDADSETVSRNVQAFSAVAPYSDGIMMSNIIYTKLTRIPASLCPRMVAWAHSIANGDIVMTDDLWTTSLRSYILPGTPIHQSKYPDSAFTRLVEMAILAGNDMLTITYPVKAVEIIRIGADLARRDPAVAERVTSAARRILRKKEDLGLLSGS